MDKLTPQLNDQQLRQNIDALQKQGVPNDKVQSYVNNYTKSNDGSYTLKPTQKAPIQQPQETPYNPITSYTKAVNTAGDSMAQTFKNAPGEYADNVKQMSKVFEGGLTLDPKKNLEQAKNFGEGFLGLLGNTVKNVYAPVGAGVQIASDMVSDNPLVQKAAASPLGKPLEVVNKLNDWAKENPEHAKNLTNGLNLLMGVLGEATGAPEEKIPNIKDVGNNLKGDIMGTPDTVVQSGGTYEPNMQLREQNAKAMQQMENSDLIKQGDKVPTQSEEMALLEKDKVPSDYLNPESAKAGAVNGEQTTIPGKPGLAGYAKQGIDSLTQGVKDLSGKAKEGGTSMAANNEKSAWSKPTNTPKASFNKATDIYKSAESQGHDISSTLVDNGIKLSDNIEKSPSGTKIYNTADTADKIHADARKMSNEMLRPALEKADAAGAPKTSIDEVVNSAKKNIQNDKSLTAESKTSLMKKLDQSKISLENRYPHGMSLVDLHDEKIVRDLNSKYSPVGDIATNAEATKNKALADSTRKLVEQKAPEDIPVKAFNAELTKQHQAANYLDALHGKTVPQSILSKIARTTAKVVGAAVGNSVGGGVLGGVGGYHIGGMVESMIEGLPNPLKSSLLDNLKTSNPEAFKAVSQYLSKEIPTTPDVPLKLPEIPEKTQTMEMGNYKLQKNPTTGIVEPTGQYRKPGVNFYSKKK